MAIRYSARKRPTTVLALDFCASSPPPSAESEASSCVFSYDRISSRDCFPQAVAETDALDEILGRFSDALALVETAHSALENAQEAQTEIGPELLTLSRGIDELNEVYTDLDRSLVHLRRPQRHQ